VRSVADTASQPPSSSEARGEFHDETDGDIGATADKSMSPLRVTLVTETFPPEINGAARSLERLVMELDRLGVTVDLVRPRQRGERVPHPTVGALPTLVVPGLPLPGYSALRFGWPSPLRLRRWLTARRPDVLHIATEGPLGWAALLLARRSGIPVTTTFHTNFAEYGRHYGYGHALAIRYLRAFHNRAQRTLAPTPEVAARLSELGVERVGVLGRGVDCELFDPARRSQRLRAAWGAGVDDPVMLHVGRLAPEKNVDLLVQLALELERDAPRAKLVIVGDGPSRARLASLLPRAVFTGQRTGEDLAEHYASADAFVFPSLTDTFGNVVTEAMASGLPTVAFDRGAARVLAGPHGIAVDAASPLAWCRAAVELARHPAKLAERGALARDKVLGLSWRAVAGSFENELRAAAATRGGLAAQPERRAVT
jgi:glycosyltransferase involved in cell wall biosynthesis